MRYEDLVVIILTALGVMLAILAIGLAIAALWGWAEIKSTASKAAIEAANHKMDSYPDAADMSELVQRMRDALGTWEALRDQIVTDKAPNLVAPASQGVIQQVETAVPPPYPKKEG